MDFTVRERGCDVGRHECGSGSYVVWTGNRGSTCCIFCDKLNGPRVAVGGSCQPSCSAARAASDAFVLPHIADVFNL